MLSAGNFRKVSFRKHDPDKLLLYFESLKSKLGAKRVFKVYSPDIRQKFGKDVIGCTMTFDFRIDRPAYRVWLIKVLEKDLRRIRRLKKVVKSMKEWVANNFALSLNDGSEMKWEPAIRVQVKSVKDQKFPSGSVEITAFPECKLMEIKARYTYGGENFVKKIHTGGGEDTPESLMNVLNLIESDLLNRANEIKERIKFLKQLIACYGQITDHCSRFNAVKGKQPREDVVMKFLEEVKDSLRKIGWSYAYENDVYDGEFKGFLRICDRENETFTESVKSMIEGVRQLKSLVSQLDPSFVKFELERESNCIKITDYVECFIMPGCYVDLKDGQYRPLPFVKNLKSSGNGTDAVEYLDNLERFLGRMLELELKKKHVKKQIEKKQSVKKSLML